MTSSRIDLTASDTGAKILRRIYNVNLAIEGSSLPRTTQELVMLRISQINGCAWCVDIHAKEAAAAGETALRLNLVAAWPHATVFTDAERAALALAEAGTRIADAQQGVSDATWAQASEHYDTEQLAALVALISLMNATNRLSIIAGMQGGSYEPGMFAAVTD